MAHTDQAEDADQRLGKSASDLKHNGRTLAEVSSLHCNLEAGLMLHDVSGKASGSYVSYVSSGGRQEAKPLEPRNLEPHRAEVPPGVSLHTRSSHRRRLLSQT